MQFCQIAFNWDNFEKKIENLEPDSQEASRFISMVKVCFVFERDLNSDTRQARLTDSLPLCEFFEKCQKVL